MMMILAREMGTRLPKRIVYIIMFTQYNVFEVVISILRYTP